MAARHGDLYVAKIQKRVAAEKNAISFDSGYRTSRVDGSIALDQNHPCHIAGHQMGILRAWSSGAALSGYQAVALKLTGKLLQRGR